MNNLVRINNCQNMEYRDAGEGKTIVLLHGFGEDLRIFENQVNFLKNYYKVITPNLPGVGNSTSLGANITSEHEPVEWMENGITEYADSIALLLNHLNVQECILFGHSMGGYITLAFVEKYPQYVKGFGLIHSTAFADSIEKKENRKRSIELIETYGGLAFLKNVIPTYFAKKDNDTNSKFINELIDKANSFDSKVLQQYYFAMMNRPDRTTVLVNSPVPVLFIIGTEDIAAPMQDVLKQVHLPKCSEFHILENVGHMSMLEATYVLNTHLHTFCNNIFSIFDIKN